MSRLTREQSAALVRTLPGAVVLAAAEHCTGHNIILPQALIDAGLPADVVSYLTHNYTSDHSPSGSIFVNDKPVDSLEGVWGLQALRHFAAALDVDYPGAIGRGTEARHIQEALRKHLKQEDNIRPSRKRRK